MSEVHGGMDRSRFHRFAYEFIKKDPGAAAELHKYVEAAITEALEESNRRAVAVETVLVMHLAKGFRKSDREKAIDSLRRDFAGKLRSGFWGSGGEHPWRARKP